MTTAQRRSTVRQSASASIDLMTFGEAMLRYTPVPPLDGKEGQDPSAGQHFLQTVGGAEVNVSVGVVRLGLSSSWVSLLPMGHLGDMVINQVERTGVDLRFCQRAANCHVGIYHVDPEHKTVHYQRSDSAFTRIQSTLYDWMTIANTSRWAHATGITPMLGSHARAAWVKFVLEAKEFDVPLSIDFNHRPALSTVQELYYFLEPYLSQVQLFILSSSSAIELARMFEIANLAEVLGDDVVPSAKLISELRRRLKCKVLAVACSEKHEGVEQQSRWCIVASEAGEVSNFDERKKTKLVESLGGGDAWVAGFLSVILSEDVGPSPVENIEDIDILTKAAKRGDRVAALSQQKMGDFSTVTMADLQRDKDLVA